MAQADPTVTGDFNAAFLPKGLSDYIFEKAAQTSVVQRMARRTELGINGQNIPVVAGKLTAGWVAQGGTKPTSEGSLDIKTIVPKKLAAITVVSAEVVRANPGNYMNIIRDQIAEAFALAFDKEALYGVADQFNGAVVDTTNVQELTGTSPDVDGDTTYFDLNTSLATLINAGKTPNGWLLDSRFEPILNAAVDGNMRPLFIEPNYTSTNAQFVEGRLLGRPVTIAPNVYDATTDTLGFLGDWSQCVWGAVGNISYSVSTEASVTFGSTLVSLWEKNLVAIMAEAEYGFLVNDTSSFLKIQSAS